MKILSLRQVKKSYGISRIEMMIGLAIGLFLVTGVSQVIISSKQASRLQGGMSRLQENGRFAMEFLSRHIRMAGYSVKAGTGIGGAGSDEKYKVTGDSVTVSYQASNDCLDDVISDAMPIVTNTFLIQDGSLWCTTSAGASEILVGGIEDMQIVYGEDLNGDGMVNRYVSENDVDNWNNLVSVQVALLVNSIEEVSPEPQSYTFRGVTVNPTDRLLREVFFTTIKLRNRMI